MLAATIRTVQINTEGYIAADGLYATVANKNISDFTQFTFKEALIFKNKSLFQLQGFSYKKNKNKQSLTNKQKIELKLYRTLIKNEINKYIREN